MRNRDPITSQKRRRIAFSPRQAFYYNAHPAAIIEDFDHAEYRAVLREIERHLIEWESQQTPKQAEWVARGRRRNYRSTRAGAKAISQALRS